MSVLLFSGGMSGKIVHDADLSPLLVIMGADDTLVISQALPFEGRTESITTTLANLRELVALAERIEVSR